MSKGRDGAGEAPSGDSDAHAALNEFRKSGHIAEASTRAARRASKFCESSEAESEARKDERAVAAHLHRIPQPALVGPRVELWRRIAVEDVLPANRHAPLRRNLSRIVSTDPFRW